jgi:hypothetical protein
LNTEPKSASKVNSRPQNLLQFEKSPYLLQHASNPVDWHPWGPGAFAKARSENKPIFLSIGYSTCHWCHVMEHESFEDLEVARRMNEVFVCIKVDREERPDIDGIYMAVCQMMTGGGGWPLTILMTPDRKPFFAGTYFPRESRFGRMGVLELVSSVEEIWRTRQDEALRSAGQITAALKGTLNELSPAANQGLDRETLVAAFEQLVRSFDERYGGFGSAPKFPIPHHLLFLLRYWKRTKEERALGMVEETLRAMRHGGIYDHIGFGFHRYSTDREWLLPHFEKMIYDQALLAMAYTEAYQATGRADYERTAREIFSYVLRDMKAPEGGFYSAEDADSEGEEGKYYLWAEGELREILGREEAEIIATMFQARPGGNFVDQATGERSDKNILHLRKPLTELASEANMSEEALRRQVESAREMLFSFRCKRIPPHQDDKILADWNGLMIAALAKGAQVFDEAQYAEAARRACDFIWKEMRTPEGRLLHRYRDGESALPSHVDDYAFLIWGMLELYEASFEIRYLRSALELNGQLLDHFWDDQGGGFFFTADDGEKLLVRQKEVYDGAIPSGNSVAMLNLLRLARITGNSDWEEKAASIGRAFSHQVKRSPSAHSQFLVAVDFALGPSYEVVIAGHSQAEDTKDMFRSLRSQFLPNKVVLFRPLEQESPDVVRLAPFLKEQTAVGGRATAYVCLAQSCHSPITEVGELMKALEA